jgi:hypothetical protein
MKMRTNSLPVATHRERSAKCHRIATANTHAYERKVENVVGTIFDEITNAITRGDRVETRGFGVFSAAALGEPQGCFAFRTWRHSVRLGRNGSHVVMARARDRIGQTQPAHAIANPSGYHHNAVQRITQIVT